MALVGSDSEDLQKTLVKLQAVQASLASVEEIRSVLEKESALRITAVTIAEKGRAAATALSTFVTNGASLSLKAFKAALVATGIGAFIVVLGSVIAYWDELTQAIGLSTKSTSDYTAALDKLASKEQRRLNNKIELQKNELKLAELKGESDKQLFEREKKINDLELSARERQRETDQKLIESFQKRRKLGENFTDDEKQRFEQLKENEKNYYSDIRKIEFNERLIKETFASNERKKEEERRKEADERRQEAERKRKEENERLKKEAEEKIKQEEENWQNEIKLLEEGVLYDLELSDRKKAREKQDIEQKKKQREDDLAEEIRIRDAKVQIANDLQSTLTDLGNLIINDSAKAVKFNKAMALIQIGIDTATALSKALSVTQSPSPDNVATGGLAGVAKYAGIAAMIFANAAKAKQILASGNGSATPPTLGGGGMRANIPTQLNAPQTPGQQSTILRNQTPTVKAIVVESDITTTQKRVNSIKQNATI
jgi:DNA repair exonuclease SbcCD ATPase subunit